MFLPMIEPCKQITRYISPGISGLHVLYNIVTRNIVQMATKTYCSFHRGMTWGKLII